MPQKPLIAINCDIKRNESKCADYLSVYADYAAAVEKAGGTPVLLSPLGDDADIESVLGKTGGLVLVGCEDLDPEAYGQERHEKTSTMSPRKQEFDMRLITAALRLRVPTLAICGGLQELNVALGGTLHQHIPDVYGMQLIHMRAADLAARGEEQLHGVNIESDSLLARATGSTQIEVNSSHHQSVDKVGEGLRVVARAADGVVEALEFEDKTGRGFLLAVQWHPERIHSRPEQLAIFEALINAAVR